MKMLILMLLVLSGNLVYPSGLKGKAAGFSAYHLEKEENLQKVLGFPNLSLRTSNSSAGFLGWFEYDVQVDVPGWYELLIDFNPLVANKGWTMHLTEYKVDGRRLNDYPGPVEAGRRKAGNIWMDKGLHKFRLENTNWYTQCPFTGYEFRPVGEDLPKNIRIGLDARDDFYGGSYYAVGESFPVHVYTGGGAQGTFVLEVVGRKDHRVLSSYRIDVRPSATEQKHTLRVSANEEGSFYCRYKVNGREIAKEEALRKIEFSTINTSPARMVESVQEVSRRLVYRIDCSTVPPDYEGNPSRLVNGPAGRYRETGPADWDYYAYVIPPVEAHAVYIVEADIPDDAQRGIQLQFRERDPVNYIIGPGVETGTPYPNSGKIITQSFLFWPRFPGERPRIAVVTPGNHEHSSPAAVSEIRVYRADGPLPALPGHDGGREFAKWFEEPLRWPDPYGAKDKSREEMIRSAENLARTMRYSGATTLFLAADVYGMGMYPSSYRYSSRYTGDPLRLMLLVARKYGLKVIADISPKQGTLTTRYYNSSGPARYQLFLQDKNGKHFDYKTNHYTAVFNPAHPEVRLEIKRKTAELAERYKEFPEFSGVSVRIMNWEQHTMTSFGSLDWGYGPYTGKLFSAYLGITDPGTPQSRYTAFTGKYRTKWIDWRVDVVHSLLKEVRDTCRRINPGFTLYSTVHSAKWEDKQHAKEAGIDNFRMEGFRYVNGLYSPGRSRGWPQRRQNLTGPEKLRLFESSRAHLAWYQYFEAGKKNIPNSVLGLRGDDSKWISAHLSPAGVYATESYALSLAATDAVFLGNGGNTYFIDPPEVRRFLSNYIALPADQFATFYSGSGVIVRELRARENYFYLLNTSGRLQQLKIRFTGSGEIIRLWDGKKQAVEEGQDVEFELDPFQLYAFKANQNAIGGVTVNAHNAIKSSQK